MEECTYTVRGWMSNAGGRRQEAGTGNPARVGFAGNGLRWISQRMLSRAVIRPSELLTPLKRRGPAEGSFFSDLHTPEPVGAPDF